MKKQTNKETIYVNLILDESGSMATCKNAVISGFNEYIESLQKTRKVKYVFTFTKFDSSKIDIVHDSIPIKKVSKLNENTFRPGLLTPLYDAIGKTIISSEKFLKENKEIRKTLFVIMTDGEENCSLEFDRNRVFSMIKEKEKEGWTFVYIGANQDSWLVGESIGLSKGNILNYTSDNKGTKKAYDTLIRSTAVYMNNVGNTTKNFFIPF